MNKIFFFIHIFLILFLAYLVAGLLYKTFLPVEFFTNEFVAGKEFILGNQNEPLSGKISYVAKADPDKIISRNLFQTLLDSSVVDKEKSSSQEIDHLNLELTRLELSLWGTVTGNDTLLAVIEDKKLRRQSLYMEGDEIQDAVIKRILRHCVVLTINGDDQLLEMEEESKSLDMFKERSFVNRLVPGNSFMEKSLDDRIMDQDGVNLKLRPYFMEDRILGLMLYGINLSSAFRILGFRNGDVITAFDQKRISGYEDIPQVISELTKEGITNIKFLRGGQENEITYTNENGKYRLDSRNIEQ